MYKMKYVLLLEGPTGLQCRKIYNTKAALKKGAHGFIWETTRRLFYAEISEYDLYCGNMDVIQGEGLYALTYAVNGDEARKISVSTYTSLKAVSRVKNRLRWFNLDTSKHVVPVLIRPLLLWDDRKEFTF